MAGGFYYGFNFYVCCFLKFACCVLHFVFFLFFPLQRTRKLYVYRGKLYEIMNKLCKTKPNSKMLKFNLNPYMISIYDNNLEPLTMVKQSQTNPKLNCHKGYKPKSKPTCGEQSRTIRPNSQMSMRGVAVINLFIFVVLTAKTCYSVGQLGIFSRLSGIYS
jgi:hypothetical protein